MPSPPCPHTEFGSKHCTAAPLSHSICQAGAATEPANFLNLFNSLFSWVNKTFVSILNDKWLGKPAAVMNKTNRASSPIDCSFATNRELDVTTGRVKSQSSGTKGKCICNLSFGWSSAGFGGRLSTFPACSNYDYVFTATEGVCPSG